MVNRHKGENDIVALVGVNKVINIDGAAHDF